MASYISFISDPLFAQFATDDINRQILINQLAIESDCEEDISRWIDKCNYRDRAVKYLIAHKITIYDRLTASFSSGTGSQVSSGTPQSISVSRGSQSISFKLPTAEEILKGGNYTDTLWGVQYLQLRRKGTLKFIGKIVG